MNLNLPNKLTVLRVLLIPVFLWFLISGVFSESVGYLVAAAVFVIASATDWLDGYLARKYKLVTNFGKLMDPLADKLLVAGALVAFTGIGLLPAWVVIILISREFIVTAFRMIALEKGVVIAAGKWGKLKTVTQMVMIVSVLLQSAIPFLSLINPFLILLSVVFCVVSAIEYIAANREILKD